MDDLQIIQLYWDRDPEAIAQTHQKYGPYCFTLAHRILASREDAEECVNDTWLHAWNGMPPHRPNVLRPRSPGGWPSTAGRPARPRSGARGSSPWCWRSWPSAWPRRATR